MDNPEKTYHDSGNIRSKDWRLGTKLHRDGGPASVQFKEDGSVSSESWYWHGVMHRIEGPSFIVYYNIVVGDCYQVDSLHWYKNGKNHRLDGPARIWYYENGDIKEEQWWINGNKIDPQYDNYPLTKEQIVEMKMKYG